MINRILQNNEGNTSFHFAYNIEDIKNPQFPFIIFMIVKNFICLLKINFITYIIYLNIKIVYNNINILLILIFVKNLLYYFFLFISTFF